MLTTAANTLQKTDVQTSQASFATETLAAIVGKNKEGQMQKLLKVLIVSLFLFTWISSSSAQVDYNDPKVRNPQNDPDVERGYKAHQDSHKSQNENKGGSENKGNSSDNYTVYGSDNAPRGPGDEKQQGQHYSIPKK